MLGTKYAFSNLNIYFSSIFYKHNNKKDIHPRDTFYLMTILDILFYLFLTIGLKLSNSIGPRLCILVSLIIQYLSFALFSFYYENPYNALFLLGIFNIGNSLSSLTTIRNTWKYFPSYIGTINGIIISGSGISSFILTYICEFIIVKSNINEIYEKDYYKKNLNISDNFMIFIYVIGCVLFACGILSFLFCIEYREEIVLKTRLNESESDGEEDISDYDSSRKESLDNSRKINAELYNGLFSCKNLQLIFLGFIGLCK